MVNIRTDHEEFCNRTARKTAAAFLAKLQFNLRYRERLRREAMDTCGAADTSTRIKRRAIFHSCWVGEQIKLEYCCKRLRLRPRSESNSS